MLSYGLLQPFWSIPVPVHDTLQLRPNRPRGIVRDEMLFLAGLRSLDLFRFTLKFTILVVCLSILMSTL